MKLPTGLDYVYEPLAAAYTFIRLSMSSPKPGVLAVGKQNEHLASYPRYFNVCDCSYKNTLLLLHLQEQSLAAASAAGADI